MNADDDFTPPSAPATLDEENAALRGLLLVARGRLLWANPRAPTGDLDAMLLRRPGVQIPLVRTLRERELPRCEAMRTTPYFNDRPATDKRCCHTARYDVGGRMLCRKHGGVAALDLLEALHPGRG